MKKMFCCLSISLLAIVSCSRLGVDSFARGDKNSGRGPQTGNPEVSPSDSIQRDVYFCTVKAPAAYNWQQDSLCGQFNGRITFYKNMTPVFELKAGPLTNISPFHGCFHILDGHLYTEAKNCVLKDKEVYYETSSKELLSSLICCDSHVYTLSSLAGGGFCYRCDATVVLQSTTGTVHGMYEDNGNVYFCYYTNAGGRRQLHIVCNGMDSALELEGNTQDLDARMRNGVLFRLYVKDGHYYINGVRHCSTDERTAFEDGELVPYMEGCGAVLSRTFEDQLGIEKLFLTGKRGVAYLSGEKSCDFYVLPGGNHFCLYRGKDNVLKGVSADSLEIDIADVSLVCNGAYTAPSDFVCGGSIASNPFVWDNGTLTKLSSNGYVTAVGVSLTKTKDGSRLDKL